MDIETLRRLMYGLLAGLLLSGLAVASIRSGEDEKAPLGRSPFFALACLSAMLLIVWWIMEHVRIL